MASLASLSLFPATKEQTLASRKRTFIQWSRGLTEDHYLARDANMDVLEHAANGKLITWILAPRDDPTTLDFKCSCETFRRKGYMKTSNMTEPEEITGYSIASVYCPPENRGKGYAKHMMRLLHWAIAPHSFLPPFPKNWGLPPPENSSCGDARFSALYSDVGHDFYRTAGPDEITEGWITRDPIGTLWDVPKDITTISLPDAKHPVEWLSEEGCKAIWKKDAELMRVDMTKTTSNKVLFTILPDSGVAFYLIGRATHYLSASSYEVPSKWGVCIYPSEEPDDSIPTFATWTVDVRVPPNTLIVTRLRATEKTFPQLLSCILFAARESDKDHVEVWNLPQHFESIAHDLGGRKETREEHLNQFKWYGTEKNEDVDWLFNEKFCWC